MYSEEIYGLTPKGENELQSSATTLSAPELELLIRIDPALNISQLQAALPPEAAAGFWPTIERLQMMGLVAPVQLDTFGMRLEEELAAFTQHRSQDEAEASERSLRRSGYYVGIARRGRAAPPASGQPLTAVVVEDDQHLSRFVSSYLKFGGFTVRVATNRAEVLSEFRKPPVPSVVLLDVMLPDVDGFEVLASLRRHPAFRNVPIIMLTGKSTREAVLKGLAGGADGYITKPFEPEALMAAVRTVLGLRERADGPR